MENAPLGWMPSYSSMGVLEQQENLAPAPVVASKQGAGLQQQNGLKRAASGSTGLLQGDSSKPRVAFSDITNQAVGRSSQAQEDATKALKPAAVAVPSAQQPLNQQAPPSFASQIQHTLAQQQFCDPTLIDRGLQHADKRRRDWIDVDALNEDDTQACSAYAVPIFEHLREAELIRRPNALYPEAFQTDVNAKMRAILVDWLVEVAEEYKLCADTLYLSVNYIDRFLSIHPVQRSNLQLVGIACMWIASKFEEIYPPNVNDFCYITDNTYTKEQMVDMEELVLKKLKYELTVPTSKTFLRRLLQVCNPDEYLHFLSNYLAEAALLDNSMLCFLPSQVAAASVYLANLMLQRPPWDGNLQHYSTYSPRDISACVQALVTLHQSLSENVQLAAIRDKYAHPRFQSVSRIPVTNISLTV
ncbi:A-type cyclin [Dunaliella salina]|uniref:A-type cyclin n=1 Tax=Dunaliella salina TaxID=3046 RepID=A0ABQ7GUF8_DUNSA|nr:A-type cyclin [Dunaliella salina]|eukprot:KAF5838234.1 A-type cyclin [Dunaliella salina]